MRDRGKLPARRAADGPRGDGPAAGGGPVGGGPAGGGAAKTTVRRAGPTDREKIVAFNLAMARETEDRTLDEEKLRTGVETFLAHPDLGSYFLAEREGRPAGQVMVTYEWSDWRNGAVWWIQSVYVAPEHRRRGVYRALHDHLRRAARENGAVGLRLYVDRENEVAQSAYRALGMERSRYLLFEEVWAPPDADLPDGDGADGDAADAGRR